MKALTSVTAASFLLPTYTRTSSAWIEHAPFAFWLIDALRPRTIVELGTHEGFSYFTFCQAISQLSQTGSCFAVDLWKGDEHSGFYGEDVFARVGDYNSKHYSSFSNLIRCTFDEAKPLFRDGSIDLLHLDGRHFYGDVRHDFDFWRTKLSDRAVVLFHDTNVHERDFGVFKFWKELEGQYPQFEFFHCFGLGVLGFGKNLSEPLTDLFAQDEPAANATRQAYARLGQSVAERIKLDQLETSFSMVNQRHGEVVAVLEEELARTREQLHSLGTRLEERETSLTRHEAEFAKFREDHSAAFVDQQAQLENLKQWAALCEEGNKAQVGRANQREAAIAQLEQRVVALAIAVEEDRSKHLRSKLKRISDRISRKPKRRLRGSFDPVFYLKNNFDVALSGNDPFAHFREFGWKEGRDPNVNFSTSYYLARHEDVQRSGVNPLQHYLALGRFGDRDSGPSGQAGFPGNLQFAAERLAIVVHVYYPRMLREILSYVRALPAAHKLFVTTTAKDEKIVRSYLAKSNRAYSLHVVTNRGRDVLPFIKIYPELLREGFEIVVKVHTKKSPHRKDGYQWRRDVFAKLLSAANVQRSLSAFAADPSLGMIGPEGHFVSMHAYMGTNESQVLSLGSQLGLSKEVVRGQGFFAGTMFMARADVLAPLLNLPLEETGFDTETGQLDGTLAHALERAFALSVVAAGKRIASTDDPSVWPIAKHHYDFAKKVRLREKLTRRHGRRIGREAKRLMRLGLRLAAGDSRERAHLWSEFDKKYYLTHNPDVAAAEVNPFEHYVKFGREEGRSGARSHAKLQSKYQVWIQQHCLNPGELHRLAREVSGLSNPPCISVLMPVYNTPEHLLREAIESVRRQIYGNWELCISDDCSAQPHVRPVLEHYGALDSRIKVIFRTENGHISRATNSAFSLATSEWIALLDHDDILRPHALAEVVLEIAKHPDAELIYSDEDKLDSNGVRYDPYFKPDFSRELFRSQNYLNHLTVHRAKNIHAVGGWRAGFEGSQDYDLNLRIIERINTDHIRHIPKVLYHWRAVAGSTAAAGSEKDYAYDAGMRALHEHIERMGLPAKVEKTPGAPFYRMRFHAPDPKFLVSLIIPSRDKADLTRACINSIRSRTTYKNYEILVVDNGSTEPETLTFLDEIASHPNTRVLSYDKPFNYSAINNFAARHVRGFFIGLINNDIEIISPDWLTEMASWAAQPDVGCVGAKLYYADNTIQHAGVILGVGGIAGHSHRGVSRDNIGYFGRANLLQNLSAVTAACLLVRRAVFEEVGGFNEEDLAVAFNDVDFCLRVREAGYFNVWTPYAEAYHYESASRGLDLDGEKRERFNREQRYMMRKWSAALSDPYYSPNLTRNREDFSLAI